MFAGAVRCGWTFAGAVGCGWKGHSRILVTRLSQLSWDGFFVEGDDMESYCLSVSIEEVRDLEFLWRQSTNPAFPLKDLIHHFDLLSQKSFHLFGFQIENEFLGVWKSFPFDASADFSKRGGAQYTVSSSSA